MELARTDPLAYSEVRNTAKSVASWVWKNFDLAKCDANFAALQAYRGAKGGKAAAAAKREWREEEIRNAIAALVQAVRGQLVAHPACSRETPWWAMDFREFSGFSVSCETDRLSRANSLRQPVNTMPDTVRPGVA
ncbi:hypothetical protein [Paraburkholderia sp.]|uniref:hypothetical protein n=1 Tax=Paraburkholderia sp. TaxID=1926495 RepID=UPI00345C60F1